MLYHIPFDTIKKFMVGFILMLLCSHGFSEPHTWTTMDGKTAVAEFERLEGNEVLLKKGSKVFRIAIGSLSTDDQRYAKQCAEEKEKADALFKNVPLQIFEEANYKGTHCAVLPGRIYSGNEIPESLDSSISSLILKKGFQVTLATESHGGGMSKILIAAQRDIRIPKLSGKFNNRIRYLRVLPWRNSIKKGECGRSDTELKNGWYYLWGGSGYSTDEVQWIPMAFTKKWTEKARINSLISTTNLQTIIGYNEPEHTTEKAGKRKDPFLHDPENCVVTMTNLMRTGLRIGSPSCTEGGPREWIPEFMRLAKKHQLRVDFICVHWYDWGGYFSDAGDDPRGIFNRFKDYLEDVYSTYRLPIWITEFNANPHRENKVQMEFLKQALPYMEETPFIERYAYFQPVNKGPGDKWAGDSNFRKRRGDMDTSFTPLGWFWRGHASTPAMNKEVYLGENNLCDDENEERP